MNKEKLKKIPHLISGMVILLHSLERFETGHSSWIVFLLAGVVFLTVAIFHHKLSARFPMLDILFYGIESFLCFLIAYEYFAAGKKGVPVMYAIAGLVQIFAMFMFARRKKLHKAE
ncbi:MAG: hypothetical protein EOO50_07655 [Flavobacterium sp.]|uniref:hypothetical protein n=1 Tax=Flavobacterium sp. TaxID=239 RepID=UPI0011FC5A47|nr:hypothetical protein [Flavobacterium sp.]RZJ66921.1 MAG: hypothetical protein EOO50_07655 [Flavobacterium sp.]